MLSKPSKSMILTYGPSRAGKSSFINTISRRTVTKVGTDNKESTTDSVDSFEVNLPSLLKNSTSLMIFDVPGKYDSKMKISNTKIKRRIEETMISILDSDNLSAILAFEALSSESIQLRSTLADLEEMFGPHYNRSTLVVLTKADKIADPEELDGAKKTAEGICRENKVRFIYLRNNHKKFTLSDAQYNEQFDNLMDSIKSLSPYLLRDVQERQNKIKERAEHLKLTLPRKKKTVPFEYETQELIEEKVPVQKSRIIYEVQKKRRGGPAGWFGAKKRFIVSRRETYIENETRYRTVTVTKTMSKEMEVEYDDSHYRDLAIKEQLEEIRMKYQEVS